ncbi:MAG TPA: Wzz/FepE/Etk N-terminal domain-containing protein [Anaerolineae bacterium]|nr:Wzz/FepE/Etk N-terminal domain-containing protein [Anaerolineae bacterium]
MEDEIDLRRYWNVLTRQWRWVIGLAIVAAVAAFGVSFLVPPAYEAAALLVVTRPRYQLQFDPRIQTVQQPQQAYRAYPELALSDDLLLKVIDAVNGSLPAEERDLLGFRGKLAAEAGADPSLVRLSAADGDPQRAQAIANAWADLYVAYANDLYQPRESDAAFFTTQVAAAGEKLEAAERALVDFQGHNPIAMLTLELTSTQTALTDYLAANRTISLVIQDAQSLHQQLAQQDAGAPVALSDELSALYLQVDALSSRPNVPIQLQIGGGGSLTNRTVSEQAVLLDTLIAALQGKSQEIGQRIEALRPDVLRLQAAVQIAQVELDQLTRERDTARDTYLTLTRKLDEARVAAEDGEGEVRLASRAAVPMQPASPRKGLNAAVGGVLGLMLGVIGAFVIDARRSVTQPSREPAVPATVKG